MCRDIFNLRLTGEERPDRADSGSSASPEDSDSSANEGERGASLWLRSSTRFDLMSMWWISGGGVRLNKPVHHTTVPLPSSGNGYNPPGHNPLRHNLPLTKSPLNVRFIDLGEVTVYK